MANPWLGLAAYSDPGFGESTVQFCGRTEAIRELTSLIETNLFVTLYGHTGVGKTSLLRAGVFPRLRRDGYTPVILRLKDVPEDTSFCSYIVVQILAEIKKSGGKCIDLKRPEGRIRGKKDKKKAVESDTVIRIDSPKDMRAFFATHRFVDVNGNDTYPVVVVDQFEEALNHQPKKSKDFLSALHLLIDDSFALKEKDDIFHDETNFRFVVAIREDDLYLFEDIVDENGFNEFKFNRYRLRSLSNNEAREVVTIPGKDIIEGETSNEKNAVADKIITVASEIRGINTLNLSLFCSLLFNRAEAAGEKISSEMVDGLGPDTLKEFYTKTIKNLPRKEKEYLESKLIDSDGRRESISEKQFEEFAPHAKYLLEDRTRILQSENHRIELVHDLLAQCIHSISDARHRTTWRKAAITSTILTTILLLIVSVLSSFSSDIITFNPFSKFVPKENLRSHRRLRGFNETKHITFYGNDNYSVRSCKSLKSVTIEGGYGDILHLRLEDCPSLTDLTLPSGLKNVSLSIYNCPNLGPIEVNDSIESLEILSNEKLSFNISADNKFFKWENGILFDNFGRYIYVIPEIGRWKLAHISREFITGFNRLDTIWNVDRVSPDSLIIFEESGIRGIKDPFYSGTLDLSSFENATWIADNAFRDIAGIKEIIFPPELISIGRSAFAGLDSLRSIHLHDRICAVKSFAFAGCTALDTVSLSSYNLSINSTAFLWCDNLTFLQASDFNERTINNCFIKDNKIYFSPDSVPYIFGKDATISEEEIYKLSKYSLEELQCLNIYYLVYLYFPPSVKFTVDKNKNKKIRESLRQLPLYTQGKKAVMNSPFSLLAIRDTLCRETTLNLAAPYIQAFMNKGNVSYEISENISVEISDDIKRKITLYVPWGCAENFVDLPEYQGFHDIKEGSFFSRFFGSVSYELSLINEFYKEHLWAPILAGLCLFVILIFFYTASWISYTKDNKTYNRNILNQILRSLLVTLGMTAVGFLGFISGYTFCYKILYPLNTFCSILTGILFAGVCYGVVFGNVFYNLFRYGLKRGLKDMGNSLKKWFLQKFDNSFIEKHPIKTLIIIVLSVFIIFGSFKYRSHTELRHQQWFEKIAELREKGENLEAYAFANGALSRTFKIMYPGYCDSLITIKDEIVNEDFLELTSISHASESYTILSPSGDKIFIHKPDGNNRIYDWQSMDSINLCDVQFEYRQNFSNSIFSPEGKRIAVHYFRSPNIFIFSTEDGSCTDSVYIGYSATKFSMKWLDNPDRILFATYHISAINLENDNIIEEKRNLTIDCYDSFPPILDNEQGVYVDTVSNLIRYNLNTGEKSKIASVKRKMVWHKPLIAAPGLIAQGHNIYIETIDSVFFSPQIPVVINNRMYLPLNGRPTEYFIEALEFVKDYGIDVVRVPEYLSDMQFSNDGRFVLGKKYKNESSFWCLYDLSSSKEERRKLLENVKIPDSYFK